LAYFFKLGSTAMQREKKDSKEVKVHDTYSLLRREEKLKPGKKTEQSVGLLWHHMYFYAQQRSY
jgi:hypothetical protein